jgi:hypothetical protein
MAGGGSVALSWTPVTGASSYNVYMGTRSGAEGVQPQMTVTTASATITALSSGTAYYFTVAAVDAGGASSPSSEVSATPTAPGGGGGGALDWLGLGGLAGLASASCLEKLLGSASLIRRKWRHAS